MATTLLTTGLACVIAAIVGGGLKAFGIEFPILNSGKRQLSLAALGIALLFVTSNNPDPVKNLQPRGADSEFSAFLQEPPKVDKEDLLKELQFNNAKIDKLVELISKHEVGYAEQGILISEQEQAIAKGEGTPESRVKAQATIHAARAAMVDAREVDNNAREIIGKTKQRNQEIERILASNK